MRIFLGAGEDSRRRAGAPPPSAASFRAGGKILPGPGILPSLPLLQSPLAPPPSAPLPAGRGRRGAIAAVTGSGAAAGGEGERRASRGSNRLSPPGAFLLLNELL